MHFKYRITIIAFSFLTSLCGGVNAASMADVNSNYTITDKKNPSDLRIILKLPMDAGEAGWKQVLSVTMAKFLSRENRSANIEILNEPFSQKFNTDVLPSPLPEDFIHQSLGAALLLSYYQDIFPTVTDLQKISINGKKALRFRTLQEIPSHGGIMQIQDIVSFFHKDRIVTLEFTAAGLIQESPSRKGRSQTQSNVLSTYPYERIIQSIQLEYDKP